MPTLGQRMFKMKEKVRTPTLAAPHIPIKRKTNVSSLQLLSIRLGPGAAVLPKDIRKISLRFAPKIDDGHRGSKRFFKKILPRLKYHNPALKMVADRAAAQSDPAVMTILWKGGASSLPAPAAPATSLVDPANPDAGRVTTIQMKFKDESEILQQLYEMTGAQEVKPTEVEAEELREMEASKERSRQDSERQAEVNRQRKKEAEMLAAARGETGVNPLA